MDLMSFEAAAGLLGLTVDDIAALVRLGVIRAEDGQAHAVDVRRVISIRRKIGTNANE